MAGANIMEATKDRITQEQGSPSSEDLLERLGMESKEGSEAFEARAAKLAAGEPSIPFEELALRHLDGLYSLAMRLSGNASDAEDLVQETMLKAYSHYASFTSGTNMKAWLFRILHNTFINGYRKRRREPAQVDLEVA